MLGSIQQSSCSMSGTIKFNYGPPVVPAVSGECGVVWCGVWCQLRVVRVGHFMHVRRVVHVR